MNNTLQTLLVLIFCIILVGCGLTAVDKRSAALPGNGITASDAVTVDEYEKPSDISTSDAALLDGKRLYDEHCAGCHGDLAAGQKANRGAEEIRGAIKNIDSMTHLSSLLDDHQIDLIAEALLIDLNAEPTCDVEVPTYQESRLLTKHEYRNTLVSLFGNSVLEIAHDGLVKIPDIDTSDGFTEQQAQLSREAIAGYVEVAEAVAGLAASSRSGPGLTSACLESANPDEKCIKQFIERFGERTYRRPLESSELDEFAILFQRSDGSTSEKLEVVIMASLISPKFLFKYEMGGAIENGTADLTQFEVAARLAYLLTDAPPDDLLIEAAKSGQLVTDLQEHARRLTTSDAGLATITRFFREWLHLGIVEAELNPAFSGDLDNTGLAAAANQELDVIIKELLRENAAYKDLMTTRKALVSHASQAAIYGVSVASGTQQLGPDRGGLLTRIGFLATGTEETSPIHRGVFVREKLLCESTPPPPADAESAAPPEEIAELASTREEVHILTSQAPCSSCHAKINPLGFAFENFDALGRLRDTETIFDADWNTLGTTTIDSRVKVSIDATEAEVDGAASLASVIGESHAGNRCFTEHWVNFAHNRSVVPEDQCSINRLAYQSTHAGSSIIDVFLGLILSDNFLQLRWQQK